MNKNIVMGLVVAVFVVVVGAFLFLSGDKAFNVSMLSQSALGRDEAELSNMSEDLEAFSQDNNVLSEVDQTFADILDEQVGISAEEALDEASIASEASGADLGQTLNTFAADEAALQELGQAFGEVAQ